MRDEAVQPWGRARLAAFRFVFVYAVLFLTPVLEPLWAAIVPRVGHRVLGIERSISPAPTGSGDRTFDWVMLACAIVLALVGAALWGIASRRRDEARLHAALRVGLRYLLAFTMLGYGFHKLFPLQFPVPEAFRLIQTYGESSPMGLLWTFMGHSPAYVMFTGFAEVLGGALLLSRRTTTLGALVVIAVMSNVVMLNLCYDVPVKIHSTHWLLIAVLLVLPDLRRLADVFVLQRPTTPVPLRRPFSTPRRRRMWIVAKSLVIAVVLASTFGANLVRWREQRASSAAPVAYDVETFTRDGIEIPPLVTDPVCWRRVVIAPRGLVPSLMDGSKLRYRLERADDGVTLTLTQPTGEPAGTLVETTIDDDHELLTGTLDGANLEVRLRRIPAEEFLLTSRGFHWVSDVPFHR